ncbi:MAG: helix-turn-helix transcriptional regulator [Minwuiales bacterium]|nr:helix-turn-helix transcriptional regulator [Minwuiales bacterium]
MAEHPDPVDVHVGRRLREARLLAGQSQTALGRALGVTFQQVQKYENGANRLGSSRLWQAAQHLNISLDYFFEGLPGYSTVVATAVQTEPAMPPVNENEEINEELPELVQLYYQHGFNVRRAIKGLVKAVADRDRRAS